MPQPAESWSTRPLAEFLALIAAFPDERSATRAAVERVIEAVDAEVAAVVEDGAVTVSVGFPAGAAPPEELLAIGVQSGVLELPGLGKCQVISAELDDVVPGRLVVARATDEEFLPVERDLLGGMARVLTLTRQMLRSLDERLKAEGAVRERDQHFRLVVKNAQEAFISIDEAGVVTEWNPVAETTFGWSAAEALGQNLGKLVVPARYRKAHDRGLRHFLATGEGPMLNRRIEIEALHRDGREFPVEMTISATKVGERHVFNAFVQDITERRRTQRYFNTQHAVSRLLAESPTVEGALPRILQAVGENMTWEFGAVWLVDSGAGVLRCAALWQAADLERTELANVSKEIAFAPGVGLPGRVWSTAALAAIPDFRADSNLPRADAAIRSGLAQALALPLMDGSRVVGVLEFFSTEIEALDEQLSGMLAPISTQVGQFLTRKQAEQKLAHQALHDALTGLPNRSLLLDRAKHALERSRRHSTTVAVLFLDVDRFKRVNDSLGHQLGDQLLVAVAGRIDQAVRGTDTAARLGGETVARLGGDEFVVLCEDLRSEQDAIRVAERISASVARPLFLADEEVSLTASIGIAVAAGDATPESLVRDADVAMYRAKERGRGRYELFDEAMRARVHERLRVETDLGHAIERGELRVFYQPILAVSDGSISGVEALVRWAHPSRGLVPPVDFISIAEDSGLIVPIGEWVLREACMQSARWRAARPDSPPIEVSVNLSARQLTAALPDTVRRAIEDSGIDPANLALELTESLLIEEIDSSSALLDELNALGVSLMLDDFGTGHSSLSYLQRLPIEILKLDRSFVSGLGRSARDQTLVGAAIGMARALGMSVVAEGVETEGQLECLRDLACQFAQGYLFAPPAPADQIVEVLDARVGRPAPIPRATRGFNAARESAPRPNVRAASRPHVLR